MMTIIVVFLGYLVGSLSSAVIVCRLLGLPDPRTQGSRNPGATNVLRLGGKKAAIITLLGDSLKGFLPVFIVMLSGFNNTVIALVALAALLGHLFPIFFRFEGGKGVATAIGCLFALSWPAGLCWLATWILVALVSRYASLAGIVASLLAPLYVWYFTHNTLFTFVVLLMGLLVILRHHRNIQNLWAGTEKKIGRK